MLDSHRLVFIDMKKNRAARFASNFSGASRNNESRYLALKTSKLGKRKKLDASKRRCKPPRYYTNFVKSGLPKRLMFNHHGRWVDHEAEVIAIVKKEFELKKATIEIKISGHHLVFDFVRMVQFNFKTALELPLAWIDEDGNCFFPEVHSNVDQENEGFHPGNRKDDPENRKDKLPSLSAQHGVQEIKLQIDIEVNGVGDKVLDYCGETGPLVKRIKIRQNAEMEDSCNKVCDVRENDNVGKYQCLDKKDDTVVEKVDPLIDAKAVREMFLGGMNMAEIEDVVGVGSTSGSMGDGRLELFMKQVEITKKFRGNANVRYAWLGSTKEASAGIMVYGLGHFGLKQIRSTYGIGLHLSAEKCANISASCCNIDENGISYMVLCRVVMGNMEMVDAGSKQFHPSTENFDTGVDDIQNPQQYVVWGMNINTHIYPEYVVSFRVPTKTKGSVLKHETIVASADEISRNPSNVGNAIDMVSDDHESNITRDGSKEKTASSNSTSLRVPKSPWMPFPILFPSIKKQIPSCDMKLVLEHYEQFRNKATNRETFVKNLRDIVGDAILKTTLLELNDKIAAKKRMLMSAQNQEVVGEDGNVST